MGVPFSCQRNIFSLDCSFKICDPILTEVDDMFESVYINFQDALKKCPYLREVNKPDDKRNCEVCLL